MNYPPEKKLLAELTLKKFTMENDDSAVEDDVGQCVICLVAWPYEMCCVEKGCTFNLQFRCDGGWHVRVIRESLTRELSTDWEIS